MDIVDEDLDVGVANTVVEEAIEGPKADTADVVEAAVIAVGEKERTAGVVEEAVIAVEEKVGTAGVAAVKVHHD